MAAIALAGGLAVMLGAWVARSLLRRSLPTDGGAPGQGSGVAPSDTAMARYRLVLVDPQDSRNIGMVARVCANFDVEDVWLVSAKQVHHTRSSQRSLPSCGSQRWPLFPTLPLKAPATLFRPSNCV
eukprot:EG_transcript_34933